MVMQRGPLILNGHTYALSTDRQGYMMRRSKVPPFAPVVSESSFQSPRTFENYRVLTVADLRRGLGRRRIPSEDHDTPAEYRRFWDGDLDTRWSTGIYLPLRPVVVTENVTNFRALLAVGDDLRAFYYGTGQDSIVSRKFDADGPEWESTTVTVESETNLRYGDSMYYKDVYYVSSSSTTRVFVNRTTTDLNPTPSGNVLEQTRLAVLDGNGIVAFTAGDEVGFFENNTGTTWSERFVDDLNTDAGPTGFVNFPGTDGVDRLYVGTEEGLWEVDTENAGTSTDPWTAELIDPMPTNEWNCWRMIVHQGMLYYGVGVEDNAQFILRRMTNRSGFRLIEDVSVSDDGLPPDALGSVTAFLSVDDQLFVGVGGLDSDQHARLFALLSDDTWHCLYRHSVEDRYIEDMAFSTATDGVPRIHMLFEQQGRFDETVHLEYPLTHPESGVVIPRNNMGFVVLPELDAGLPHFDKGWLQVSLVVDGDFGDLTSGNVVRVDYAPGRPRRITSDQDFDSLDANNHLPFGLWSDGETMWVVNAQGSAAAARRNIFAYNLATQARESTSDIPLHSDNALAFDAWSNKLYESDTDEQRIWVTDFFDPDTVFCYELDGTRDSTRDLDLDDAHSAPLGIWGDGTHAWVSDYLGTQATTTLLAYDLSDGSRAADEDFTLDPNNTAPFGIWGNDDTLWVTDSSDSMVYAYNRSDQSRRPDLDFPISEVQSGLWSDGTTFWLARQSPAQLRAYQIGENRSGWTDLGTAVEDKSTLAWPDGGLASDRLSLRLRMERGVNIVHSPALQNIVVAVLPEITTYQYTFSVNVEATASQQQERASEILKRLRAAAGSTPLVAMKFADDPETYVDIVEYDERIVPEVRDAYASDWQSQSGVVAIVARERFER